MEKMCSQSISSPYVRTTWSNTISAKMWNSLRLLYQCFCLNEQNKSMLGFVRKYSDWGTKRSQFPTAHIEENKRKRDKNTFIEFQINFMPVTTYQEITDVGLSRCFLAVIQAIVIDSYVINRNNNENPTRRKFLAELLRGV